MCIAAGSFDRDLDAGIAICAARYREAGMPVLFRLPSIVEPAIEARLDGLSYRAEGETLTLYAAMDAVEALTDPDIALAARPDTNWLTAMIGAQGHTGEKDLAYRRIVEAIAIPAVFVALRNQGQLVSLAYGALHDRLLMCESVVTLAAARGRGYARRTLTSLMAWGLSQGAQVVCLQVQADNHPAVALYRRLGLRAELYRYHYRREPPR